MCDRPKARGCVDPAAARRSPGGTVRGALSSVRRQERQPAPIPWESLLQRLPQTVRIRLRISLLQTFERLCPDAAWCWMVAAQPAIRSPRAKPSWPMSPRPQIELQLDVHSQRKIGTLLPFLPPDLLCSVRYIVMLVHGIDSLTHCAAIRAVDPSLAEADRLAGTLVVLAPGVATLLGVVADLLLFGVTMALLHAHMIAPSSNCFESVVRQAG